MYSDGKQQDALNTAKVFSESLLLKVLDARLNTLHGMSTGADPEFWKGGG